MYESIRTFLELAKAQPPLSAGQNLQSSEADPIERYVLFMGPLRIQ